MKRAWCTSSSSGDLLVERQKELPVVYRGMRVDVGYRLDLLIEREVVVELKSVEKIEPIHEMQLVSYLRLSGCKLGLLINFNATTLKNSIRRVVNNL